MDRYVVIGNPVAHSQSPRIHAAFARQTGQTLTYERLECAREDFASTLRGFAASGGRGCNVTLPFKFEAFQLAAERTARAEAAGACNTLRRDGERWFGDNTDGAGLRRDIEGNARVALGGRRVLLIGAGGAAAGVLGPLLESRPAEFVVANRTLAKALDLLAQHASAVRASREGTAKLRAAALDDCGEHFDVVINATSSSIAGIDAPVHARVLAPGSLALDMMYGPAAKPFLAWAATHGAVARDGLGMLVEQAAEAFKFFRGVEPETAPVLAAMRAHLAASAT